MLPCNRPPEVALSPQWVSGSSNGLRAMGGYRGLTADIPAASWFQRENSAPNLLSQSTMMGAQTEIIHSYRRAVQSFYLISSLRDWHPPAPGFIFSPQNQREIWADTTTCSNRLETGKLPSSGSTATELCHATQTSTRATAEPKNGFISTENSQSLSDEHRVQRHGVFRRVQPAVLPATVSTPLFSTGKFAHMRGSKSETDFYPRSGWPMESQLPFFAMQDCRRNMKTFLVSKPNRFDVLRAIWIDTAATSIQRHWRGYVGRLRAGSERRWQSWIGVASKSATRIQTEWRAFVQRQAEKQERILLEVAARREQAALVIQKHWKQLRERHKAELETLIAQMRQVRQEAAIALQRLYRGFKARKVVDLEHERWVINWRWDPAGRVIELIGSFTTPPWGLRMLMMWDPTFKQYTVDVPRIPGRHEMKFIVDGEFCCDGSLTVISDGAGHYNNVVYIGPNHHESPFKRIRTAIRARRLHPVPSRKGPRRSQSFKDLTTIISAEEVSAFLSASADKIAKKELAEEKEVAEKKELEEQKKKKELEACPRRSSIRSETERRNNSCPPPLAIADSPARKSETAARSAAGPPGKDLGDHGADK